MMAAAPVESAPALMTITVKSAALMAALMAAAKITPTLVRLRGVTVVMMVRVRFQRIRTRSGALASRGARQPEPEAAGAVRLALVQAGLPTLPVIHATP